MTTVQKHSKKRDAILNVIRSTDCHPSAEWIYNQVKPVHPDISLGTVYRNLSLFEQNGDIITVATVDGQKRYDATTKPHTHFICECCGEVIDIETSDTDRDLYEKISSEHGFTVRSHNLTFYGLCVKCRNSMH